MAGSDSSDSETYVPDIAEMREELASMRNSLHKEGLIPELMLDFLDYKKDGYKLDSAEKHYQEYFEKARELYAQIDETLAQVFHEEVMDSLLEQLKNRTDSICAPKVLNKVDQMSQAFEEGDVEGMESAFEHVKAENQTLQEKVNFYFKLGHKIENSRVAAEYAKYGKISVYSSESGESLSSIEDPEGGTHETGESFKPKSNRCGDKSPKCRGK